MLMLMPIDPKTHASKIITMLVLSDVPLGYLFKSINVKHNDLRETWQAAAEREKHNF